MPQESLTFNTLSAVDLLEDKEPFPLPRIVPLEQSFSQSKVADLRKEVFSLCRENALNQKVFPGMKVAVTAGSRGISGMAEILKALIDYLHELGAIVAIIPAMGSHGGPSDQGQIEVLANYGISEATMGVEVRSSLAVTNLGQTEDGLSVWFSTDALSFDKVIVVNRVKPHTDFSGQIESGIMKMCAIGLGKHRGASYIHAKGFHSLGDNILKAARLILAKANILAGLAIVENAYKEVAKLDFFYNEQIENKEAALLKEAKALMPSLPLDKIDLLLVQQIGKDISGAMFDPNITGRRKIWGVPDFESPKVGVMAALELTTATHGNAAGLAVADICSTRLLKAVDFSATYTSLISATLPQHAHIPMFFRRDDEIVLVGAKISCYQNPSQMIFCWIQDTSHITRLWVSENAVPLLPQNGRVQVIGDPRPIPFDHKGILSWEDI